MQANRTATGPLKFGDDWPGVFIRGDEALGYAGTLRRLLAAAESRFTELAQDTTELAQDEISAWMRVKEFAALLESCRAPQRTTRATATARPRRKPVELATPRKRI